MSTASFKAGLALAAELHEAGRLSYSEYLALHQAMTFRHARGAEHTVTIEWREPGEAPTWTLDCHAGPRADCKLDEDADQERYGEDCNVVSDYRSADYGFLAELITGGRVTFPVFPEWDDGHWDLELGDERDATITPGSGA
ncbi:MAG: hypothetical protein M3Y20_07425 [Actinomycetota bacterium]|nr:hypothetical protein [Actinomycetota bacterium]